MPDDRLLRLSNAEWRDGGDIVAFRIERRDGRQLDLSCPLLEIGDIFSFLATAAEMAAAEAGKEFPSSQPYFAPIPVRGLGFAVGRSPDETLIVVNLAGFALAFSAPNSALAQFGRGLGRTAQTLSASSETKN
jgi:hypothetical protein